MTKQKAGPKLKVEVTFKDPDGVWESMQQAVKESLADLGLDDDEMEAIIETRTENVREALGRWIRHGEYLTVVFDLETGTATVQEPAHADE